MTRRAAAVVLAVTLTALALAASVGGAGALEPVDALVSTTTSIVDVVVGAVTDDTPLSTTTTRPSSTTTSTAAPTTTTSSSTTSTTSAPTPSTTVVPTKTVVVTSTTSTTVLAPTPVAAPGAEAVVAPVVVPLPTPALLHESPAALSTPSGPRSTLEILGLLDQRDAPPYLVARVLAPFPVAGRAHYGDDWGAPRHGHTHQGCDIFAPRGTPVIAAMDGTVDHMTTSSPLGGTSLHVTLDSGTYFYYAHLDRFAPGITEGRRVRAGDVVGFVGNTGNAATTAPHLHFEIHPLGGEAVPPVPYLDRWLAEAAATARALAGATAVDAISLPRLTPEPVLAPAASRAPRVEPLTVSTLRTQPVSAVDPTPMLALAGVVVLFSWLAQRGKRRARAIRRLPVPGAPR